MPDRWIITRRKFREHRTLEAARAELARLQDAHPELDFHLFRIKTTLAQSNHRPVIEAARELAALWDNRDIAALERSMLIGVSRARLIEVVHEFDGEANGDAKSEAA